MRVVDEIAGELLHDWEMKETVDYVRRGRRFNGLAADKLKEAWASAFRQWIGDELKGDSTDMDDCAAELRLRGERLPHHLVRSETETLFSALIDFDPEEGPPGLDRDIEAYLAERAASPN